MERQRAALEELEAQQGGVLSKEQKAQRDKLDERLDQLKGLSLEDAMEQEAIDRNLMVKEGVKGHKGLLGAGPTNTNYGKSIYEHKYNLALYWALLGASAVAVTLERIFWLTEPGVVDAIPHLSPDGWGVALTGGMIWFAGAPSPNASARRTASPLKAAISVRRPASMS